MNSLARATLVAVVVGWAIAAHADEGAAKAQVQPPQVQVQITLAEFDQREQAEIDRALGRPAGLHEGLPKFVDPKVVRSLEERKLLRMVAAPKIRMPGGSAASVSFEHGEGLDGQGELKPVKIEIEVEAIPKIELGKEPTIVCDVRYRETTGKDGWRRVKEIDTGMESKAGEPCALHFTPRSQPSAKPGQPAQSLVKMLFVTTTIVEPKPAGESYPDPRTGEQALRAKRKNR